jgi:hypothetical protein
MTEKNILKLEGEEFFKAFWGDTLGLDLYHPLSKENIFKLMVISIVCYVARLPDEIPTEEKAKIAAKLIMKAVENYEAKP